MGATIARHRAGRSIDSRGETGFAVGMLPKEIKVERHSDKTSFELPRPRLGLLRFFGPLICGLAVYPAWLLGEPVLQLRQKLVEANSGAHPPWALVLDHVAALLLTVFIMVMLMPFSVALSFLSDRTRVSVWKDRLELTEFTGPLDYSRWVEYDQLERLEIRDTSFSNASNQKHLSADWGIAARLKNGEINWVARWHPRELLKPLAEELSSMMQSHGKTVPVEEISTLQEREQPPIITKQRVELPAGEVIESSAGRRKEPARRGCNITR